MSEGRVSGQQLHVTGSQPVQVMQPIACLIISDSTAEHVLKLELEEFLTCNC